MKNMKLKEYLFKRFSEEQIKLAACLSLSIGISVVIYAIKPADADAVPEELRPNLTVMIPKGHLLYPFEAANFESVEPLLDAYNMVQVYHPKTGRLIAKNIKVLRAPKDPSHLAFLIPVSIANKFAPFGLNFKIAVQKYINKKPLWVLQELEQKLKEPRKIITFGEKNDG